MGRKVRSARGLEVDFDLLKVKQQIAEAPAVNVASRTEFVEKRLRRRTKRSAVPTPVAKVAEPVVEDVVEDADVEDFEKEVAAEPTDTAQKIRPTTKKT